eukprot:2777917-Pyramimonas_sp.AAC.1
MGARVKADGRLSALHGNNRSAPFWPDGPRVFSRGLPAARGAREGARGQGHLLLTVRIAKSSDPSWPDGPCVFLR